MEATRYRRIEKLGQGTYGVVYKAVIETGLNKGNFVALKKVRLDDDDGGVQCTVVREVSALKKLRQRNIVELLDVARPVKEKVVWLVFELMHQNLKDRLDESRLEPSMVQSYLHQVLKGLHYMHGRLVMHRDLKPQNVLLDERGEVAKICDFGLSRAYRPHPLHYSLDVITLWYRPPEILLGDTLYTTSVDLWSLGCIFAEMVTSEALFPGDSDIDQLLKIVRGKGTPDPKAWSELERLPGYAQVKLPEVETRTMAELVPAASPDAADLMEQMLTFWPAARVSTRSALAHPFFRDFSADGL